MTWYMNVKSARVGDCIVPTSNQKRDYPQVRAEGKSHSLHRLSYEAFRGPTRGMEVHHTCANPRCFNPDHLELVSRLANVAEMKERHSYIRRIAELELALTSLAPEHELLRGL